MREMEVFEEESLDTQACARIKEDLLALHRAAPAAKDASYAIADAGNSQTRQHQNLRTVQNSNANGNIGENEKSRASSEYETAHTNRPSKSAEHEVIATPSIGDQRAAPRVALSQHATDAVNNARMNGFGERDGANSSNELNDTQVLPSQVYTDYLNNKSTAERSRLDQFDTFDTANITFDHGPATYNTNDTGHVDFAEDFDDEAGDEENESDRDHTNSEDDLIRKSETGDDTVTSPTRLSPTTPGLAGNKRDRFGNVIRSAGRTAQDDLSAMFGAASKEQVVGLSQVFHQTQAPSSPPLGAPRSDPIFERPSPDFRNVHFSSPVGASPLRNREMQRANTDPRGLYVSMKDSQELRDMKRKQQEAQVRLVSDDGVDENDEDFEIDIGERRAHERKRDQKIRDNIRQISGFGTHTVGRQKTLKSSTRSLNGDDNEFASQVRTPQPVLEPGLLEGTENDLAEELSETESVHQFDEYSGTVISSGRGKRLLSDDFTNDYGMTYDSSSPRRANPDSNGFHNRNSEHAPDAPSSTNRVPSQTVRVADSQTENKADDRHSIEPPRPILPSSVQSRNFISQSQGFSHSNDPHASEEVTEQVLDTSSMPFRPSAENVSKYEQRNAAIVETPPAGSPAIRFSRFEMPRVNNQIRKVDSKPAQTDDQSSDLELSKKDVGNRGLQTGAISSSHNVDMPVQVNLKRRPIRKIPDTSPEPPPSVNHDTRSASNKRKEMMDSSSASFPAPASSNKFKSDHALQRSHSTSAFDTARAQQSASTPKTRSIESNLGSQELTTIQPMGVINRLSPRLNGTREVDHDYEVLNEDDNEFLTTTKSSSLVESNVKRPMKTYTRRRLSSRIRPGDPTEASANSDVREEEQDYNDPTSAAPLRLEIPHNNVEMSDELTSTSTRQNAFQNNKLQSNVNDQTGLLHDAVAETPQNERETKSKRSTTLSRKRRGQTSESELEPAMRHTVSGPSSAAQSPERLLPTEKPEYAKASSRVLFPNRVFARFNGQKFYPATCLGMNGLLYKIRFDDGNIDDKIPKPFVKSFELRPGDVVKVDEPERRVKEYVVRELKDRLKSSSETELQFPLEDIYGHQTAVLETKPPAKAATASNSDAVQRFEVPICRIYILDRRWSTFAERVYDHDAAKSMQHGDEPGMVSFASGVAGLLPPNANQYDPLEANRSLFEDMVFAITYSARMESEKSHVTSLIRQHGGTVLSDGFEELFQTFSLPTSPSKHLQHASTQQGGSFALSEPSANLKFAALITDSHSRRTKYMQALALNMPCLSGRWIVDCVSKKANLPWDRYLLPSGESLALGGAIRSRTFAQSSLTTFDASKSVLKDSLENRPKLLEGHSAMMLMGSGMSKTKAEEKRTAYLFLMFAMGAKRVESVKDYKDAKALLDRESVIWDWVFVDDGKVDEARAELMADELGIERHSKRRKGWAAGAGGHRAGNGEKTPKVVSDEFVVQSLILGELMEHK